MKNIKDYLKRYNITLYNDVYLTIDGIILDKDFNIIQNANIEFSRYKTINYINNQKYIAELRLKEIITLDDKIYFSCIFPLCNVWGHWSDTLQKIYYLLQSEYNNKCSLLFDDLRPAGFRVKEPLLWLKYLGNTNEIYDLTLLHKNSKLFKIKNLLYMNPITWSAGVDNNTITNISKIILENTKKDIENINVNSYKKVFVIRHNNSNRIVSNFSEINQYLIDNNYLIYEGSKYSFLETVKLFNSIEYIVGIHNSGFKNCMFSPNIKKIIEYYPMNWKHKFRNNKIWIDTSIVDFCKNFCNNVTQINKDSTEKGDINISIEDINLIDK